MSDHAESEHKTLSDAEDGALAHLHRREVYRDRRLGGPGLIPRQQLRLASLFRSPFPAAQGSEITLS